MSLLYETIGRLVVHLLRLRYGRRIRAAGMLALAGAILSGALGAYLLASRDVEEG